jgi:hypothetical protein
MGQDKNKKIDSPSAKLLRAMAKTKVLKEGCTTSVEYIAQFNSDIKPDLSSSKVSL